MASKWSFICNTKRLRQCKHLILKTTAAALSLCRTKTRFPSSLMVSASFIFKREETRLRTWGTVCAVRERERRQQKRAGARFTVDERSACSPWSSRASSLAAAVTLQLQVDTIPLKGKTLIREEWGETGKAWGFFLFFFSYAHFHVDAQDQPPSSCHTPPVGFRGKGLQPNRKMLRPLQRASAALTLCARCRKKTWQACKKWCRLN